jgi:ABC-type uncharacterized transport system substrate-binding protein
MRRRDFIKAIAGAVTARPFAARAQAERVRNVGVLVSTREEDADGQARLALLRQGFNELGWVEGRNIHFDYRWAAGDAARAMADAAALVSQKPDVIIANSTMSLAAVKNETTTIPIVFVVVGDPIGQGFVSSLVVSPTRGPAEIDRAITAVAGEPKGGLIVNPDAFTGANRGLIVSLAARYRLPAIYPYRFWVVDGGLISYGHDANEPWRRAPSYVDRILKGANPADLPIQQPTKFELIINLRTAKTLGLTIPPQLLDRADELIE